MDTNNYTTCPEFISRAHEVRHIAIWYLQERTQTSWVNSILKLRNWTWDELLNEVEYNILKQMRRHGAIKGTLSTIVCNTVRYILLAILSEAKRPCLERKNKHRPLTDQLERSIQVRPLRHIDPYRVESDELDRALRMLAYYPERTRDIFARRFALAPYTTAHTLREIGVAHSLTRERVRIIIRDTLESIREDLQVA